MPTKSASGDLKISQIAARQHGVVALAQLLAAGVTRSAVKHRVAVGRLHSVHRGVYAVGHAALSTEGRWFAAVLACRGQRVLAGPDPCCLGDGEGDARSGGLPILELWGAALSQASAAELWNLLPRSGGPVDISIPCDPGRRQRRGMRVHRSLTLLPADVTLKDGIPVTKPARTISDLRRVAGRPREGGGISHRELRRAIRQAEFFGLPLGAGDGDRTRSELERDFLRICRRHRLSEPEVNVRVDRYLVDFLWRERRLVVETDGYVPHRGKVAFQDDRERDLKLRSLGYAVIRLSERQINEEPGQVANFLRGELAP